MWRCLHFTKCRFAPFNFPFLQCFFFVFFFAHARRVNKVISWGIMKIRLLDMSPIQNLFTWCTDVCNPIVPSSKQSLLIPLKSDTCWLGCALLRYGTNPYGPVQPSEHFSSLHMCVCVYHQFRFNLQRAVSLSYPSLTRPLPATSIGSTTKKCLFHVPKPKQITFEHRFLYLFGSVAEYTFDHHWRIRSIQSFLFLILFIWSVRQPPVALHLYAFNRRESREDKAFNVHQRLLYGITLLFIRTSVRFR